MSVMRTARMARPLDICVSPPPPPARACIAHGHMHFPYDCPLDIVISRMATAHVRA